MDIALTDSAIPETIAKTIYAATLCYACVSDIRRLQIPNAVSLVIATLFLIHYGFAASPPDLEHHLAAGAIAFVMTFGLYLAGVMGAGDVKLISALMIWAGVRDAPAFLLTMTLLGGLLAALLLSLQKTMALWPGVRRHIPSRRLKNWAERGIFPYGVAICAAGLALLPSFFAPTR